MAYTVTNYPSKAALKRDLAAGVEVETYQPGPFGDKPRDGVIRTISLEGPHYPAAHTWYAEAKVKDGFIVPGSVK